MSELVDLNGDGRPDHVVHVPVYEYPDPQGGSLDLLVTGDLSGAQANWNQGRVFQSFVAYNACAVGPSGGCENGTANFSAYEPLDVHPDWGHDSSSRQFGTGDTANSQLHGYLDFNGDGLADRPVYYGNLTAGDELPHPIGVRPNVGAGFPQVSAMYWTGSQAADSTIGLQSTVSGAGYAPTLANGTLDMDAIGAEILPGNDPWCWRTDPQAQTIHASFIDLNGDGILDQVNHDSAAQFGMPGSKTLWGMGDGSFHATSSPPVLPGPPRKMLVHGKFVWDGWDIVAGELRNVPATSLGNTICRYPTTPDWEMLFSSLLGKVDHDPMVSNLMDVNADGLLDYVELVDERAVIRAGTSYSNQWRVYLNKGHAGLLVGVHNEVGGHNTVQYQSSSLVGVCQQSMAIADGGGAQVDTCGETQDYTRLQLGPSHPVVKSVSVDDGRGSVQTTQHMFYGRKYHLRERENLGMRVQETVDGLTGMSTRNFWHQELELKGRLDFSEQFVAGKLLSSVDQQYDTPVVPFLTNANTTMIPSMVAIQRTYDPATEQYNQQGSRTHLDRRYGFARLVVDFGVDGLEATTDDNITVSTFVRPNEHKWIVQKPRLVITRVQSTREVIGRQTLYYDDNSHTLSPATTRPTRGLVTAAFESVTGQRKGPRRLIAAQRYDDYGNVTAYYDAHVSDLEAPPLKEITYDDALHTFVDEIRLRTGGYASHAVSTRYATEPKWGKVTKVLGPSGDLKCRNFDEFGRLMSKSNASLAQTSITASCDAQPLAEYHYCTGQALDGSATGCDATTPALLAGGVTSGRLQYVQTSSYNSENSDAYRKRQYFDGRGRTYKTAVQRRGADPFYVTMSRFDDAGREVCTSEGEAHDINDPFFECELAQLFVNTRFDAYQRPSESYRRNADRLLQMFYSMEDKDADGALERVVVQVHDGDPSPDRTVLTATNARGQVVWLQEVGGGTTRITYDVQDRPVLIDGPDIVGHGQTDQNLLQLEYNLLGERVSVKRPAAVGGDGPQWHYHYDSAGRVAQIVPPRGETSGSHFYYDAVGRMVRRDFHPFDAQNAGAEDFAYDYYDHVAPTGKAALARIQTPAMEKKYHYNFRGELEREERTIPSVSLPGYTSPSRTFEFQNNYDRFGVLQSAVFPDGEVVTMTYSGERLSSLLSEQNGYLVDTIQYDPVKDRLASYRLRFGNVTVTHDFNADSQVERISSVSPSDTHMDLRYDTYDRAGNPLELSDGATTGTARLGRTYAYDDLHRLARADYDATPATAMGYDPAGNVVCHNDAAGSGGCEQSGVAKESFIYASNLGQTGTSAINAWFERLGPGVLHRYDYDTEGQLVAHNVAGQFHRGFVWDADGRMTEMIGADGLQGRYWYDENGVRTRKIVTEHGVVVEDRLFVTPGYWATLVSPSGAAPYHQKLYEVDALSAVQTKHAGVGDTVSVGTVSNRLASPGMGAPGTTAVLLLLLGLLAIETRRSSRWRPVGVGVGAAGAGACGPELGLSTWAPKQDTLTPVTGVLNFIVIIFVLRR